MWPFHRHEGKPVSARHGKKFVVDRGQKIPTGDVTKVLFRCDGCGSPFTNEYDGHWTLDELFPVEAS